MRVRKVVWGLDMGAVICCVVAGGNRCRADKGRYAGWKRRDDVVFRWEPEDGEEEDEVWGEQE